MSTTPTLTKELVLSIGGDTIARATEFGLTVNKETIDITTLDSDGWKEKLADLKEYSISFGALVTRGAPDSGEKDFDTLLSSLINSDTALAWTLIDGGTGGVVSLSGNAFLNNLDLSGSVGDKVTYSGSLDGTGAIVSS